MNNNNSFNNINTVNNNSNNVNKLSHALFQSIKNRMKKSMANLNVVQKIVLLIVFVILPLSLLVIWLRNLYTTNTALAADYDDLVLYQNIPFIGAISMSDSDYIDFYKAYLTYYYPNKISNDTLNLTVNNTSLTDELPNQYTYSFWINITGNSEGLTNYVNNTLYNNANVARPVTLTNYTWTNYRYGLHKEIFHRGDYYNNDIEDITTIVQYPGFWLGPDMNNMLIMLSNGSKNENFVMENIAVNKWVHILCTLEGNSISLYRDGEMEFSSYTNGTLYTSSIKNKNLYFLGNLIENTGFPGFISEFKFYNRVLSPENIELLYKKGLKKFITLNNKVNSYMSSIYSATGGMITNDSTVYTSVNSSLNCN
jgi:hypothetical protein